MKIYAFIKWAYATIIYFVLTSIYIVIFYFLPKPWAIKSISYFYHRLIMYRVRKTGKVKKDTQMLLINHESDLDVSSIEMITTRNLAWVAKKELFYMPWFGYALRMPKHIMIERESKTSLIKLMKDVKDRVDNDRLVCMFPEGTRSRSGKMLPFKPGAKFVADKYQLKVQAVVLLGTARHYDIKNKIYNSGTVKAIILDQFVADKRDKEWLNKLRIQMQKVYDDGLANSSSNR